MKGSLQKSNPRPVSGPFLPPSPSLSLGSSVSLGLALQGPAGVPTFGPRLVALRVEIKSRPQSPRFWEGQ